MPTLSEVIVRAQQLIGEADGPEVQEFSDDMMLGDAINAFELVWKKYEWEQYIEWSEHTLDGTLGIVDADAFTNVKDFEDFLAVHRSGESSPLPVLSSGTNPLTISGTRVQCWTALPATSSNYATRRLQFYPKTSIGDVVIRARVHPLTNSGAGSTFTPDTVVHLDKDMLAYGTAFYSLVTSELNPGGADAFRILMESRFQDITAGLARRPQTVRAYEGGINDWQVR